MLDSKFLLQPGVLLCLLLLAGSSPGWEQAKKPAQAAIAHSNLLLVTIDTLRPDHLSCYGYDQVQTPNIDSLATDGVRFAQAFTPIPITLPSHTVMLTGTSVASVGCDELRLLPLKSCMPLIIG